MTTLKKGKSPILVIFISNLYILPVTTIYMFMFGGRRKLHSKKSKLTKREINTLNWGEIEKRLGIDSSKEPSAHIKRKIIHDSIFARECEWFSKEDIERWKQKEEKILKQYEHILKIQ